jgi:site-specific recombinase XerD
MEYASAVAAYLADCRRRGLRPATLRYYEMVLTRFGSATAIGALDELTVSRAAVFQDASAHLSPGSVRGFVRALKTFATWAHYQDLLPADPLARLRLPRADRRVIATPSDEELCALLGAANPRLRIVIATLAATGMRVSELCSLGLDDLRPAELRVATGKNRSGRLVPLDALLSRLLLLYVADLRASSAGSLLVSRTGRPLSADAIRHALADARQSAGLAIAIGPHVLRHWHARDLAAHGATDRLLAARMGWSSTGLLARYAPVGQAEVAADARRYSPLLRLRDDGVLDGLLPPAVLWGPDAQRSKYVRGAASAARSALPWARHS